MMSKSVTAAQAAALLLHADHIVILTHQYPDGDTLGSGFALCRCLQSIGKTVRVVCADEIPEKYAYMMEGLSAPAFEPAFICAVDVADKKLLGGLPAAYTDNVDLCIDHHGSNTDFARHLLLDADCAATAMLMVDVIDKMGIPLDRLSAECLYTGLATDTGCFRYANTSAKAHRLAADLMDKGIRYDMINRTMFDMKSRARVELERMALDTMRFFFDGRCAIMTITNDMIDKSGAQENDMEGLAPLPRQIEGVWVGVTLRQKADGNFKVSVRTGNHADASAICAVLGGGGHLRAAGCTLEEPLEQAVNKMLDAVKKTVSGIV